MVPICFDGVHCVRLGVFGEYVIVIKRYGYIFFRRRGGRNLEILVQVLYKNFWGLSFLPKPCVQFLRFLPPFV